MTLFEHEAGRQLDRNAPLAARMRPRTFDELVGQEHVVGPGRVLRRAIEADRMPSIILWGPPGSGKTTLANLVATATRSHFSPISAVGSGVADLRREVAAAQERLGMHGQRTILFIDEIHRFNKAQQDVILPHVESGAVILIGATTENPSFEVNAPLLSRSRVFTLQALTDEDVETLVRRAVSDAQRGLGAMSPELDDDAMAALVTPVERGRQVGSERVGACRQRRGAGRLRRPPHNRRPGGGCNAAPAPPLRPGRRRPLRHHIRLHQVGEGVGPRTPRSTGSRGWSRLGRTPCS